MHHHANRLVQVPDHEVGIVNVKCMWDGTIIIRLHDSSVLVLLVVTHHPCSTQTYNYYVLVN